MLTRTEIRFIALEKGYKDKLQPDGNYDLNPYVYETIYSILNQVAVAQAK